MYRVEMYARVRRACRVEGMSTREASRVTDGDCGPHHGGYVERYLTAAS